MQVAPRGGTVLVGSGRTCFANQNLGVARALAHQFWFSCVNRISFLSFDNPTSSTNHQHNGQVSVRIVNIVNAFITLLTTSMQPPQHLPEGHRGPGDDPQEAEGQPEGQRPACR